MKYIISIASVCLVIGSAAILMSSANGTALPETPTTMNSAPEIAVTGTISGWSVRADGSVALRMAPRADGEVETAVWFKSPASQTETTRFEGQVVDLLIACSIANGPAGRDTITIRGKGASGEKGVSLDEALDIIVISSAD